MRRAFSARGVLRPLWVMGAAVSLVITSALPSPVHAEDPQGGPNTAVVRCAFIKHLNDDPIRYPGYPGHSHSHDFSATTAPMPSRAPRHPSWRTPR